MRGIVLLVVCSLAGGCVPPTIMQLSVAPVDMEMATAMLQPGTGLLKGSALLRQRGGGVVTCAGNDVHLIPATESVTREMRRIFRAESGYVPRGGDAIMGGGTLVNPPTPNRRGICNAQGSFTFDRVRAGRWHVMTTVIWSVGDNYQGGTLLTTFDLVEGGEAEVVLTNQ
jgi:hypothetical protein